MVINEKLTTGSMKDYIVEQGTTGVWSYRKWNSGIAEIWFTQTQAHQFSSTVTWGSVYESPSVQYTYPENFFISEPLNLIQKGGGSGGWLEIGSGATKDKTPNIWVIYPVNKTNATTAYISVYSIGRWK